MQTSRDVAPCLTTGEVLNGFDRCIWSNKKMLKIEDWWYSGMLRMCFPCLCSDFQDEVCLVFHLSSTSSGMAGLILHREMEMDRCKMHFLLNKMDFHKLDYTPLQFCYSSSLKLKQFWKSMVGRWHVPLGMAYFQRLCQSQVSVILFWFYAVDLVFCLTLFWKPLKRQWFMSQTA